MRDPLPLVLASTAGGFEALAIEFLKVVLGEGAEHPAGGLQCPATSLLGQESSASLSLDLDQLRLDIPC